MASTFLVTLLLGVLFRSNDLGVAFSVLGGMQDGIANLATGEAFAVHNQDGQLMDKETLLKLIFMALVIWGLPNTQRFFGQYWSALDQRPSPPGNTAPDLLPGAGRLRFVPSHGWAIVVILLFLTALLSMDGSSRFIYYQF